MMEPDIKLRSLGIALLLIFILVNSCRHVYIVDSKAEMVRQTIDPTLNDSVLIYGIVYVAGSNNMPESDASILVEGTDFRTNSDTEGRFSLKVLPGTYTIKCLGLHSEPRFIAYLNDILLSPNGKIEVQFYIGNISE